MLLGTVYVHFDGIQLCKQATLAVWIALYDECLKSDAREWFYIHK